MSLLEIYFYGWIATMLIGFPYYKDDGGNIIWFDLMIILILSIFSWLTFLSLLLGASLRKK